MSARTLSVPRIDHRAGHGAIVVLPLVATACLLSALATRWPTESIAVAAGLLILLILSLDLALGVFVYIVAAFTFLGPKPNVTTALMALFVLGWVARATRSPAPRLGSLREAPTLAIAAIMLAGWLCSATFWAGDVRAAHNTAVWFVCDLLLFPLFYAAIHDEQRVRWCLVAIIVGGSLAAVAALAIPSGPANPYGERAQGLIGDPNTLGADLLPAIVLGPLLCLKVIPKAQTGTRGLVFAGAAVCLVAAISTGSRGAVVSLAAILLLAPLVLWRWRRAVLAVVAIGGVVGYAAFATIAPPDARKHLAEKESSGRTDVWVIGWRMVEAHPLHGVGPGNFRQESIHYLIRPGGYDSQFTTSRQLSAPLVAHNSYLHILAENGAIGLALYLSVGAAAVTCGIRAARIFRRIGHEALELAARGLVLTAGGLAVAIWFITYTAQGRSVWVVLALLVAIYGLARRMERDASLPR
jgi:O-antigen ligase